jgi:hypothetical protein
MNIFFIEKNILRCAKSHVDKHVVKMRLEYAQLACTAHHMTGTNPDLIPYKKTHENHPSAIWARESVANYLYVVMLGMELCDEMRHRFNTKEQRCEEVLQWCWENEPNIISTNLTIPKLAIPQEYIINENLSLDDSIENYRNYYKLGKINLHKWTNRERPNWA